MIIQVVATQAYNSISSTDPNLKQFHHHICHTCRLPFVAKQLTKLFHQLTLMYNFLYSLTICLLHCYPRHVSSINMPIFRRTSCIHTASGIFAVCKRLHSTLVQSGPLSTSVLCRRLQRAKITDAV